MIQTHTFKIGTAAGEYPPGSFIQDSLFVDSQLQCFMWNKVNCDNSDATVSSGRLILSGSNQFTTGDTVFVIVKK